MKPIYLEFCGINSFSEKATIDFTKLLSGGLFGIFGDTGSGKSTVLDCIHFALYGKIERALGVDSINYKCDRAYVIYEFELTHDGKRRRYSVYRERRRKNNVTKASLYRYNEQGEKETLNEGTEEVNGALEEIVGLTFDDFKKCIALPQGEFSGLVKARNADRLQLVSRLFDLEKYGARLSATIRERYKKVSAEADVLLARMQENEGGKEEKTAELRAALKTQEQALLEATENFQRAEKEWLALEKLAEEKKEYDKCEADLRLMNAQAESYSFVKAALNQYPTAQALCEKSKRFEDAKKARLAAEEGAKDAGEKYLAASARVEEQRKAFESRGFDREIEECTLLLGRFQDAEGDLKAFEESKKKLEECKAKYQKLRNKVPQEDFDRLLLEIEEEKKQLGQDESFTEYLRRHFKDVLVSETYGEVRADLRNLGEKYPVAQEDVQELIKKYTPVLQAGGKVFDVANAKLEFDAVERKRKALLQKGEETEKRKRAYEENEIEKQRVISEGSYYRERMEAAEKKISFFKEKGGKKETEEKLNALKKEKERAEKAVRAEEESAAHWLTVREKQAALEAENAARAKDAEREFNEAFQNSGFTVLKEAEALLCSVGNFERKKAETENFFARFEGLKIRVEEWKKNAEQLDGAPERAAAAKEEKLRLESEKTALLGSVAVCKEALKQAEELKEKYRALEKEYKARLHERELWDKLRVLTDKNKFMEFIASEYLQEICVGASATLRSLTGGRYYLRYDGEFKAADNLNGGILRSVKTLSGGETFLVSLSLALSLSGAICAKSLRPIEFFFLDEGFGTLDERLVDTVMDVLEKLKSKNFSVGVISHVEELKHRIDNKLIVTGATETHGSIIRAETY